MAAKRTLLIEDEREVANTLTLALRSGVYEVEQALGTRAGAKRQTGSAGYSGANAVAFGIGAFPPPETRH